MLVHLSFRLSPLRDDSLTALEYPPPPDSRQPPISYGFQTILSAPERASLHIQDTGSQSRYQKKYLRKYEHGCVRHRKDAHKRKFIWKKLPTLGEEHLRTIKEG